MVIQLFIASEYTLVRAGIRRLVATTRDIVVAGEAADAGAALAALNGLSCSVILIDLSLCHRGTLATLRRLRALCPGPPVLVVSTFAEEEYLPRLRDAGAAGYLSNDRPVEELLDAIRQVAAGHTYPPHL